MVKIEIIIELLDPNHVKLFVRKLVTRQDINWLSSHRFLPRSDLISLIALGPAVQPRAYPKVALSKSGDSGGS